MPPFVEEVRHENAQWLAHDDRVRGRPGFCLRRRGAGGFEDESKADAPPAKVTVKIRGTIPIEYGNKRDLLPAKEFHGWKLSAVRGDRFKASCSAQNNKLPTMRLYGPSTSSGWGKVIAVVYPGTKWWVDLNFTVPTSGTYLLVLNEKNGAEMPYELYSAPP